MNRFISLREKLGVTRTVIAARLGTTAESVRQWEANMSEPRHTVELLMGAYEATRPEIEKALADLVIARRRQVETAGSKWRGARMRKPPDAPLREVSRTRRGVAAGK